MPTLSIEPNDRVTFKVRYQDDHLMLVGKPAGVVTTPGLGHERDSLLNGLFATLGPQLQNLGRQRDFGLLHRLDRDTSGLVIVAKTTAAYDALRALFETRSIEKYYWAVTKGAPRTPKGLIRRPILEYDGKVPGDTRTKKLAKVGASGKPALTAYRVLQANDHSALLECRAVTGRLHQVRVHLESIGCAILGDAFYAPSAARHASSRLALHAHRIAFAHPITGKRVDVHTPWPSDLRSLLKRLKLDRPDLPSHPQHANQPPDDPVGDEEPPVGE
ncbi:MAG: RluA family pseudouridine synthase [Tepidisphaera sp.]|nr:RluA family pseudouridine synthase [Tepidisphaera sp.]